MWLLLAVSAAFAQAAGVVQVTPGVDLVVGAKGVGLGLGVDAVGGLVLGYNERNAGWGAYPIVMAGPCWDGALLFGKGGVTPTTSLGLQAGGGLAQAPNGVGFLPIVVATGEYGRTWDRHGVRPRAGARLRGATLLGAGFALSPGHEEQIWFATLGPHLPLIMDLGK